MTVSTETPLHIYTANGVTTQWNYAFTTLQNSDVHLIVATDSGVESEISSSNFTLDSVNKTVTYPKTSSGLTPVASGYKVVVYRNVTANQTLDLDNSQPYTLTQLETSYDKLTAMFQDIKNDLTRVPHWRKSEVPTSTEVEDLITDISNVAENTALALAAANRVEAVAIQGLPYIHAQVDIGCACDGSTDDYALLNAYFTANTADCSLFIQSRTLIGTSWTVPANIKAIIFDKANGSLSVPTTKVLSFTNQIIEANNNQLIFYGAGTYTGTLYNNEFYPEWFGALGDNTQDDYTHIQKAFTFLYPRSSLKFSGKQYKCSSQMTITSKTYCSIIGNDTVINYTDATASTSGSRKAITFVTSDHILVDKIKLNMIDQTQQYIGWLIYGSCEFIHLNRLNVQNARWIGIDVYWDGSTTPENCKITNCTIEYCRFGIYDLGRYTKIEKNYVSGHWNLTQEYIDKSGVWSAPSLYYDGIMAYGHHYSIINNTIEHCGQSGIYSGGTTTGIYGKHGTIANNVVRNNYNMGIDLGITNSYNETNSLQYLTITGNVLENNQEGDLHFGGCNHCVMSNNTASTTVASGIVTYNIIISGGSTGNIISNNVCKNYSSDAYSGNIYAGSTINNTYLFNMLTGTERYEIVETSNMILDISTSNYLTALSRMWHKEEIVVDLTGKTGSAGRHAFTIIPDTGETHGSVLCDKEIYFAATAGAPQKLNCGDITEGGTHRIYLALKTSTAGRDLLVMTVSADNTYGQFRINMPLKVLDFASVPQKLYTNKLDITLDDGESGTATANGREAIKITKSALNTFCRILSDGTYLGFVTHALAPQNIRAGELYGESVTCIGALYCSDASTFRIGRTASAASEEGKLWWDATTHTLKFSDGTNVKTVATV